ncbi:hypothetical protein [Arthrobacter sp. R-11]|uniref:hypothetical protein n=1 Tax=Arthrobacter sp. R-11 TaxID=3404053 RepID=UPI003CECB154
MDPVQLITVSCTALGLLGTGAGFLIKRADAKRERRETAVEALLRERIEQEKASLKAERRAHSRMKATAGKWREQLIANDIKPDPAEWPEADNG